MTEYTVKEIGRQWIVYADRRSIAACDDEASALKLIAEDSAANKAARKPAIHDARLTDISSALVDQMTELLNLRESVRKAEEVGK